jgi:hypothetical protein
MVPGKVRNASLLADGIAVCRSINALQQETRRPQGSLEEAAAAADKTSQALTRDWQQKRGKREPK